MFNDPKYEEWVKEFFAAKTEPMSVDLSTRFMSLYMFALKGEPMPAEVLASPSYRIADARAKGLGLGMTPEATALVALLPNGSPGTIVMYVSALASMPGTVSIPSIVEAFPMGFITEAELSRLWELQKGAPQWGGNFLDTLTPQAVSWVR